MKKFFKKWFSLYNLAIFVCIVVIIASLIIIFKPEKSEISSNNQTITVNKEDKKAHQKENKGEINEKKARKIASKKFKELGDNTKKEDLNVTKIIRKGEEYYYITSKDNTIEIKINGGEITRVNSAVVGE